MSTTAGVTLSATDPVPPAGVDPASGAGVVEGVDGFDPLPLVPGTPVEGVA
jgi:hypothetical protein